jgi:hypothetical protein
LTEPVAGKILGERVHALAGRIIELMHALDELIDGFRGLKASDLEPNAAND